MRRKIIRFIWGSFLAVLGVGILGFVAIWNGWIGYMPDIEDIQNPISKYASQVYSGDGKLMGTYNLNKENRIYVPYKKLSPHLVNALIATEDSRFNEHSGIDFIALGRAIVKRGLMGQESAGGGSTITQQLAKQLYSEVAHSFVERLFQKPIEWVIAIKLERNYTKEEIIAFYLNYFDYLHNAVGIKNAANTYFSKDPKSLTLAESATIIGLCKNPSYYNPLRYSERCRERRNTVLALMCQQGYISEADFESASSEELNLNFHRPTHKEGVGSYFREFLRKYMMAEKPERENYPSWNYRQFVIDSISWVSDPLYGWCNKNFKKNGEPYNIYTDGLKIYTTINTRMQRYAEEAVYQHVAKTLQPAFNAENRMKPNAPFTSRLSKKQIDQIMRQSMATSLRYKTMKEQGATEEEIARAFNTRTPMTIFTYHGERDTTMTPLDSIRYYKRFLRSGFMSMDPATGEVKAYVGGLDYEHFQFDMVTLGRRQVGSTIKPFLYSLAMESGMTPCSTAPNVMKTYIVDGGRWTPKNGSRARYGQDVTLKWGLAQSNNWISAYLMSKLNPRQLKRLLNDYGINNPDIQATMALCLGPCEVSVAEMVSAYTTFVNHGIRTAPLFVTRIEDSDGNIIAQFQPQMNEVISAESANRMITLLKGVVDGGTGGRLRSRYGFKGEAGGKTGTTNRNSDGWFMGITPRLVSGVWVGGENRDIHFDATSIGQGANMSLPVWAYYMNKVYADKSLGYDPNEKFDLPANYNPCADDTGFADEFGIDEVYE